MERIPTEANIQKDCSAGNTVDPPIPNAKMRSVIKVMNMKTQYLGLGNIIVTFDFLSTI